MQNTRLDEAQAEIQIAGRNIKTSDMQMKVKVKVTQSCLTLCDPMDCPWY